MLILSSHYTTLFPFLVSDQKVNKRLRRLFLSLWTSCDCASFTVIKISWCEIHFRVDGFDCWLSATFGKIKIMKMNIIWIDLRNILRMKDLVHKFFSRLLKFLNESRILIFIISSALEKIILVILVVSHQQNNFNLFYSISLFILIFAIQIINIVLLSSLILMFISIFIEN